MNKTPWALWVPGALCRSQVKDLYRRRLISLRGKGKLKIGACSIDLSLSDQGFIMKKGSVKPSANKSYDSVLNNPALAKVLRPRSDRSFRLRKNKTYVFILRERLSPQIAEIGIFGQATAKSSIGRVDVLVRLIVDRMETYECFDPKRLKKSSGKMFLEITSNTFNVRVRPRLCMTQLRLFYGAPEESQISGIELCKTILGPKATDSVLTLDLAPDNYGGIDVSAFCAKPAGSARSAIPLWRKNKLLPWEFWRFVNVDAQKRLQIHRRSFYILRSKERLYVPNGIAIYCRASDETIGEMRIHYAGFVHPGFGMGRKDKLRGTPLIFEVRANQVNANLRDGEKMANLVFYRMSHTGPDSLEINTDYNNQNLELSKIFTKWPKTLKMDSEGNVEPK